MNKEMDQEYLSFMAELGEPGAKDGMSPPLPPELGYAVLCVCLPLACATTTTTTTTITTTISRATVVPACLFSVAPPAVCAQLSAVKPLRPAHPVVPADPLDPLDALDHPDPRVPRVHGRDHQVWAVPQAPAPPAPDPRVHPAHLAPHHRHRTGTLACRHRVAPLRRRRT